MSRRISATVVVIGGGPAGIAAATRAAESGASVIAIDMGLRPGGQIWRHSDPATLPPLARRWLDRCARTPVRWLARSTAIDATPERVITVAGPEGTIQVEAGALVLATGARELFIPYPGWTLPNVMGAGGAQALLKGGWDIRGRRVIVAGSGPLLLPVAAAVHAAGARLLALAEQQPFRRLARFALGLWSQPSKLAIAGRYEFAIPIRVHRFGTWVTRADGGDRLESVTLSNGRTSTTMACDVLCCSYGLVPSTELARLLGCAVTRGAVVVDDLQQTTVGGVLCAGEGTGVGGDAAALVEGEIAGLVAAGAVEAARSSSLQRKRRLGRAFADRLAFTFAPRSEVVSLVEPQTVICRCEDIRAGQLDRKWTGRQAKLYARVGMGPCQGAVCGPAMEHVFGWEPGTVRPPLLAPPLGDWVIDDGKSSGGDPG